MSEDEMQEKQEGFDEDANWRESIDDIYPFINFEPNTATKLQFLDDGKLGENKWKKPVVTFVILNLDDNKKYKCTINSKSLLTQLKGFADNLSGTKVMITRTGSTMNDTRYTAEKIE